MASSSPRENSEELRRRPIHPKKGLNEEEEDDEIDTEALMNVSENKGLYPDINEVIRETQCPMVLEQSARSMKISSEITTKYDKDGNVREKSMKRKLFLKETKESDWGFTFLIALVILVICFLGFIALKSFGPNSSKPTPAYEKFVFVLKENFRSQSDLSIKVINSSLWPVVPEDAKPKRPAVIVLTSSDESAPVAECLAKKIASSLAGDEKYIHIDGRKYSGRDPDKVKEEIDDTIKRQFRSDELNVVVISRLDKIPAKSAMIFHGYCDDSYAPFRKAVYVMTVASNEVFPKEINYGIMDKIASNCLEEAWGKDLRTDQLMPLLARLTPSVSVVFPEKSLPSDC